MPVGVNENGHEKSESFAIVETTADLDILQWQDAEILTPSMRSKFHSKFRETCRARTFV